MRAAAASRGPTGSPVAVLAQLGTLLSGLREAERKIAAYVLAHPAESIYLSVTELADRTGTSEATAIRFARRLGFPGYAAFKIALALELHHRSTSTTDELETLNDVAAIKQKVLQISAQSIEDTLQVLDDESFSRAVDALARAQRIDVYGVGSSGALASVAYALLVRVGLRIVAVTDPHLQVLSAVQLGPEDVAVAISASGSTRDTVEALRYARDAGAFSICLTRYACSPITRVADVTLLASARPATVGGHQFIGQVAQLAVLEALAAATALKRQAGSACQGTPGDQ